jgi:hypothetical protein
MTPERVALTICAALKDGTLERKKAERLLGFVLVESLAPSDANYRTTHWRRCSELASLGLVDTTPWLEPVRVTFVGEADEAFRTGPI